ncbi:MAG: glycine cleavage system protein GcvH [Thermoanaerobacterales bacterium]|jgi:glycine cleavage system H protein|nr:glycine cleavage system protein GcvH [Thermoanaerobacterales bacterium]
MDIPSELRYSPEHEWVLVEDGRARVGITDYAQDALGDIVFVDLPDVGTKVERGATVSEVESTKSVSEVYAPVGGTIVEVNADLADNPDRINDEPYGEGWMFVIELADPGELDELLDAEGYRALIEG